MIVNGLILPKAEKVTDNRRIQLNQKLGLEVTTQIWAVFPACMYYEVRDEGWAHFGLYTSEAWRKKTPMPALDNGLLQGLPAEWDISTCGEPQLQGLDQYQQLNGLIYILRWEQADSIKVKVCTVNLGRLVEASDQIPARKVNLAQAYTQSLGLEEVKGLLQEAKNSALNGMNLLRGLPALAGSLKLPVNLDMFERMTSATLRIEIIP